MSDTPSLSDPGLEADMAADWAKIAEKHAIPDEPEVIEPEAPEIPAEDRGDGRRSDGTFLPKKVDSPEPEARPSEPPSPSGSAEPSGGIPVESVTGAKGAPLDITRAPSTWKPVARAEFAKLPESVRAEIHRRETDALNGQAQLLPDARLGKAVTDVIAPYRHMIEAEGGTPERAIADLMRTAALFRTGSAQQKTQALLGIARQFNVEIPQGQPAPVQGATPAPGQYQDPRVDQLIGYLQTQDQRRQQEQQQSVEREQVALQSTVTRWMEQVDDKGQPKFPYLNDVADTMNLFVRQIRDSNPSLSHEQVLQSAYDRAIWANPDVRAVINAPPPANPDRVREAKRAASVNVPRRASVPSPGKPGKMEDTIEATARELGFIS